MTLPIYLAYGIKLASVIELPLPSANSVVSTEAVDVQIRYGDVPVSLDQPITSAPAFQAKPNLFLFFLPGVGRFLVRDGREVLVQPAAGVGEDLLGLHISQSIMGALLHQRGQLPLHASAVLVRGGCVAFMGHSGGGKSTLAAALGLRGYQCLCDDICAVTVLNGVPVTWPGIRRHKLWSDAAEALGMSTKSVPRAHPEGERYRFPERSALPNQPVQLKRIYVLEEARTQLAGISRLPGWEAMKQLIGHTYRPRYVEALAGEPAYFEAYTAIAAAVPLFLWSRPWGLDVLGSLLDSLECHLRSEL